MEIKKLKTHIDGIAKILKIPEKEILQSLYDAFENVSDEVDQTLDELSELYDSEE